MAQSPLKQQAWRAVAGQITGLPAKMSGKTNITLGLSAPGLDLSSARIVWEASGQEPFFGQSFSIVPAKGSWVEAEAQLTDGRRVFASHDF
jgi:hypothetical protein